MPLERTILNRVALKVLDATWQRYLEYVPSSVVQGGDAIPKGKGLNPLSSKAKAGRTKEAPRLGKPKESMNRARRKERDPRREERAGVPFRRDEGDSGGGCGSSSALILAYSSWVFSFVVICFKIRSGSIGVKNECKMKL